VHVNEVMTKVGRDFGYDFALLGLMVAAFIESRYPSLLGLV
jgi:hypothetical protein